MNPCCWRLERIVIGCKFRYPNIHWYTQRTICMQKIHRNKKHKMQSKNRIKSGFYLENWKNRYFRFKKLWKNRQISSTVGRVLGSWWCLIWKLKVLGLKLEDLDEIVRCEKQVDGIWTKANKICVWNIQRSWNLLSKSCKNLKVWSKISERVQIFHETHLLVLVWSKISSIHATTIDKISTYYFYCQHLDHRSTFVFIVRSITTGQWPADTYLFNDETSVYWHTNISINTN